MRAFLYIGLLMAGFACQPVREEGNRATYDTMTHPVTTDTLIVAEPEPTPATPVVDTALLRLSRFYAGLPQYDSNHYAPLEREDAWLDFHYAMQLNWELMDSLRLRKISAWQKETLAPAYGDSQVVFYPFSGPDFLHMHRLFPDAREYIMAALEPIVELPKPDTLSASVREKLFDSLTVSLRDVFGKSYFITSHMRKDMKQIQGVLPLMYFFSVREGFDVIQQDFLYLDSSAREVVIPHHQLHWHTTPGVRLILHQPTTGAVKTVYYFSISLSNAGLRDRPEFVRFLDSRGSYNTFIKSASYLMHTKDFTRIRDLLMESSAALLQDDTGIPYRAFRDRLDQELSLFGEYARPVKSFGEEVYQAALDSLYRVQPAQPLPFSLGYHWKTRKQNYMLINRRKASVGRTL